MDLLEREEQLEALRAALEACTDTEGRIALVSAEAGGGKTALVRSFLETTDVPRCYVGSCDDLITPLPFGAFLEISRQIGPAVESAFHTEEMQVATAALLDALEARPHPVIMVIEDIHWADQASVDLMSTVTSQLNRLPVLLVLTHRPEEMIPASPVRNLLGRLPISITTRIPLPPLSGQAIDHLSAGRFAPGELSDLTGGNPLYVSEILATDEPVPSSIRDLVLARYSSLPERARELLEIVAIVPGKAEAALLDRCRPGWEEDAEAAEERGIINVGAHEVAFRHELTRRAIEAEILRSRRRRLHAEVLEALSDMEAPVGRLVHHADGAGDVEALLRLGPVAARKASGAGAHVEAADHLDRVLRHGDSLPPERRAELEEAYAAETWAIGDPERSRKAARRALTIRRALDQHAATARDMRLIARASWFLDEGDEAEALLDDAIELLDDSSEAGVDELGVTLAYRATMAGIRSSARAATEWTDRAMSMVDDLEPVTRASVLTDVGTVEHVHGDGDSELLERALEISMRENLHVNVVRTLVNLASGALMRRDYTSCRRWLEKADDFARSHQIGTMADPADAIRAQMALELGEWDEVERLTSPESGRPEVAGFSTLPMLITRARLQLRRGDPSAPDLLDEAWAGAVATDEPQRLAPAVGAVAEHAWLLGRLEEVVPRLESVHGRVLETGVARWAGEVSHWLAVAGASPEIPDFAEPVCVSMARGDYLRAAEEWAEMGCVYEGGMCRVLSDDAEAMLQALEPLDLLGASPLARRARSRLRELGVERVPRSPRSTTLANPAGLTARQMEVLGVLADGHTNAEIAERLYLSVRTVDHHVAAILMKLGVSTRHEAVEEARSLGLLD